MKTNIPRVILIFFLIVLLSMYGCNRGNEGQITDMKDTNNLLIQKESYLLNNTHKAICYSGFRKGQHPDRGDGAVNPSYEEVLEDLQILAYEDNFGLIRVYDSGENSEMVLQVIKENNLNIKVLLGIWLKAELSNHETCEWLTEPIPDSVLQDNKKLNELEIKKGISLANKFKDIIIAVNVGNEALVEWNDHKVDTDSIIAYVKHVKANIKQPVTVAENYKWWADHGKELAKAVDFVSIHTYPVWEGKDINEGLSYTIDNIQEVKNALPDSKLVITEAGWASVASEFGERASEDKQLQYYNEIMDWAKKMNITTFFFEAFDESWKGNPDNPMGAEKHWGIFTEDREPKKAMEKQYAYLIKE